MDEHRTTRRLRRRIDQPGLQAVVAADLNVVVSGGGTSSSRQDVHIRQRRSERAAAANPQNEEQT